MDNTQESIHNELAGKHSKNAIFSFFLIGLVMVIIFDNFFQFRTFLFFFVGMFLMSFLSIPTYLLQKKMSKKMNDKNAGTYVFLYTTFSCIWDLIMTYVIFLIFFRSF
jgi:hypothetical protein